MTLLVTDSGSSLEATGHPTECAEPVSGSVQGTGHSVKITAADGSSEPIATKLSTLHFDSHAHEYSDITDDDVYNPECHTFESHDLSGADFNDANLSSSITINGEAVLIVSDDVATDPGTGGSINIIEAGVNNSVSTQ